MAWPSCDLPRAIRTVHCAEALKTHVRYAETKDVRLVCFQSIELSAHLPIPEDDMTARVARDDSMVAARKLSERFHHSRRQTHLRIATLQTRTAFLSTLSSVILVVHLPLLTSHLLKHESVHPVTRY